MDVNKLYLKEDAAGFPTQNFQGFFQTEAPWSPEAMQTLVTFVLLMALLECCSATGPAGAWVPKNGCCQQLNQSVVPKACIRHVGKSPADCALKTITITTVCDIPYCFDRNLPRAKKMLTEFTTSPSDFNRKNCEACRAKKNSFRRTA